LSLRPRVSAARGPPPSRSVATAGPDTQSTSPAPLLYPTFDSPSTRRI